MWRTSTSRFTISSHSIHDRPPHSWCERSSCVRHKGASAMNNRHLWRASVVAVFAIVIAAAIGIGAYNAGMAHGIAASGPAVATLPPGTPFVYVWSRPWGFGFFPFFPIFFLFFFFFVLRRAFWGGPWRGGWAYRPDGVPPAFEEWHRRAHAAEKPAATPTPGSTT